MVPPPDQNGHPAANVPAAPEAKLPQSNDDAGRILTGKQEHCETLPLIPPSALCSLTCVSRTPQSPFLSAR